MKRGIFSRTVAAIFVLLSVGPWAARPAHAQDNGPEIRSGIYRGRNVTYAVIHGQNVYEGDILLEKVEPRLSRNQIKPPTVGVAYPVNLWPGVGGVHQIPYVITNGAINLTTALNDFNTTFPNFIQFIPRTSQTDYVNFDFDSGNFSGQCESSVGRVGGEQTVGGSASCSVGTLLHECGHVVGLWHEQSRSDRDQYVTYNYQNVIKGSAINFNQLLDNAQNLTLYDYGSIMHYIPFAFSANGGPTLESMPPGIPLSNTVGYTAADIDGIMRLYSVIPTEVTVTTNPPGLQIIVDGATVTAPQVFPWTLNSMHTLDIPANAQTQNGTTYIYGRWNDSTAASHTITVTPGDNMVSQPSTAPAVTVYTANFIELVGFDPSVYPANSGTMTEAPSAMTVTGASGLFYTVRQGVTLTATPNTGYNFYSFSSYMPGAVSSNPKTVYMESMPPSPSVQALFTPDAVTTVATTPGDVGIGVLIDNSDFWYTPKNFSSYYDSGWTTGSTHTLSVSSPQLPYSINTQYVFHNWSDGGAQAHMITVPPGNSVFAATMTPEFVPVYYVNEGCAGGISVAPISTMNGFYDYGTVLTFTETPASGWKFTGWQNDLSGKMNPQTLTLSSEALVTADYNTTGTPLTLGTLSPSSATAGAAGFTLTLNGTGFTNNSNVYINNTFRVSKFISPTEVTVSIMKSDLAMAGAFQAGVQNYPSGAPCAAFVSRTFFVLLAGTSTTLTSSLNPSTYGQSFALTATVTPQTSGKPTGTVSFAAGNEALGNAPVIKSNSQAKLTVGATKLKAGTYAVVGTYSGDNTYLQSISPPLSQVINKASTTAGLASSQNPSTFGQPVTFTATISPQYGGIPTGNATFKDGHTKLGTGKLTVGQATFTTSALSHGTHSIIAVYAGDTNFTGSTSPVLMQMVN
jgi:hypothetical protein